MPEIPKEPKKLILKDKYGEIIINKLETYVEPVKQIKEARGDTSTTIIIFYFFFNKKFKNLVF